MNTKHPILRLALLAFVTVIAAQTAFGQANQFPPGKMTFQGFLTDASTPPVPLGNAAPENKTVTFKIYRSSTSSASTDVLWAETQVVTVDQGHFSVLLGEGSSVSGLPHSADLSGVFIGSDASDRWIGITVDDVEITPRIQFFAAPYAQLARAANSLVNNAGQTVVNLTSGNPTINGSITSSGSVAGLIFDDRGAAGPKWQWYSSDGSARLWSDSPLGDKLTVTSAGNVGIGTSSPSQKLDINGKLTISDGARSYPAGISTEVGSRLIQIGINEGSGNRFGTGDLTVQGGMLRFDTRPGEPVVSIFTRPDGEIDGDGTQRLVVLGNGNVGIGTIAPSEKMHVSGGTGRVKLTGTTPGVWFDMDSSDWFLGKTGADGKLAFWNGADRMVMTAGGNVGIGAATPSTLLQIGEGANVGTGGLKINTGWVNVNDFSENRPFEVQVKGSSKLVVNTQGNVGIGTGSPATALDVRSDAAAITVGTTSGGDGALYLGNSSHGLKRSYPAAGNNNVGLYTTAGDVYISANGLSTSHLVVKNGGNVGIGVTSPAAPLHVKKANYEVASATRKVGMDTSYGVYLGGNAGVATINDYNPIAGDNETIASGALSAVFDGDIIASYHVWVGNSLAYSDARAKNVAGLSDSARDLTLLRDIKVRDFTWIDRAIDNHRPQKKLVAQEVEQVFPQAVQRTPHPTAIPNVYQLAEKLEFNAQQKELRLTVGKPHDFKAGDSVDLYTDDEPLKNVKVIATPSDREFTVSCETAPNSVFVYGKYVNDFRSVDYDAIAMLNVSATQELARRVESFEKSEARIAELERKTARMAELEQKAARVDSLERRVEELTKLVAELARSQGPRHVADSGVSVSLK